MNQYISHIAILGGTHGNERLGVYLTEKWRQTPLTFKDGEIKVILANPEAAKANRRYIDQDLNRSFSLRDLEDGEAKNVEQRRARELNKLLGPKGGPRGKTDFIIDLHASTATMGASIIITDDDPLSFWVAKRLQDRFPDLRIVQMIEDFLAQPYITSLAPHAITIEVGPIPQGVVRFDLLRFTENLVKEVLSVLEEVNEKGVRTFSCEVFSVKQKLDYPKDKNGLQALIHPNREGGDFSPLAPGDPLFITSDGRAIPYGGKEICYPLFINEAAYYEKGIALMLAKKIKRQFLLQ